MKDSELLSAARAAVVMYELLISREGLSPQKKEELKTTFLRNQGYKMVSGYNLFSHPDGTTKSVKEQALINCYADAIKPIAEEIINQLKHNEKALIGLVEEEGK